MEPGDLDHGEATGYDEGGRDEVLLVCQAQVGTGSAAHEHGRCDNTSQHGNGMLETQQHGQQDGHLVVEAEEGRILGDPLHEGEVGAEQEGIVVGADEAFLCGEGMLGASEAVAHGLPRGRSGDDVIRRLILIHCDELLSFEGGEEG